MTALAPIQKKEITGETRIILVDGLFGAKVVPQVCERTHYGPGHVPGEEPVWTGFMDKWVTIEAIHFEDPELVKAITYVGEKQSARLSQLTTALPKPVLDYWSLHGLVVKMNKGDEGEKLQAAHKAEEVLGLPHNTQKKHNLQEEEYLNYLKVAIRMKLKIA